MVQDSKCPHLSRRKMFKNIIRALLCVAVATGLSACGGANPLPVETTKATSDQNEVSSPQASCTQLDYSGDPAKPDSVTLTCEDGDKIVIPGPFESGDWQGSSPSGQGAVASKDGPFYIPSVSGKHYVWYYFVTQSGEFRVWHDGQLIERSAEGEKTISKVAIRDFKSSNKTTYLGW